MIMGSSGAGKTTLGNLVANELGYTFFVDIDEYIVFLDMTMELVVVRYSNMRIGWNPLNVK